ncbi:GNAT family N-acetyltransferase [Bariatricus massiliensis]|uniref:GNAT family N-acetyltransferase n=1 Tax=Bariatricus massiliensis TaxID=1745713 RepID=A0ABS8DJE4_9FIRM|nr:GNAT family N-acetyltransferase [Bariatricus massiliensis]MCB7305061.1 GNAT family N-acetyltransferase [Bariatricus massiliensis]MCB7375598.1 GNAT family N-acetyltransferase [Bariatricus massiliensis]MCB7388187.1 GNAT family N-acetyltransferase [Bariatricus massiliensis]MCB7412377.1 GNAT family N-acetyltransferase [Bariatricus massiliensis]MCQ5254641.1 GNAT family N-acetyltransferase [Bariatricus massiliensis]
MIRKATKNDLKIIMDIWLSANVSAHNFISEEYWNNHFEEVRTAISSSEIYVFEDSVIKGFVGLKGNYIAGIFIKEEFQSKGIGGKLISFLKTFKPELILNVYEQNKNAVEFYEKHGFQISQKNVEEETGHIEYQMIWRV